MQLLSLLLLLLSLILMIECMIDKNNDKITIPIIDVSSLITPAAYDEDMISTANLIDEALQTYGLFIAINHNSKITLNEAMDSSNALFSLNLESKMKVKMDDSSFARGYIPEGKESGLIDKYYEPKEGYSYGSENNAYYDVNPTLLQYKNIWPIDLPIEEKTVFDNVFIDHTNVAKGIITALQIIEDNNNNNDNNKMDYVNITKNGEDISIMRLFHYFPFSKSDIEVETEMICSSPHTDWGFLTVILQDNVGGLQFKYDNKWIDVPVIENGLIINGGDFLRIVSKYRYISPIHRVICPKAIVRNSFVFFFYPTYDSLLPITNITANNTDYNTLLSISSKDSNGNNELNFGDYVIKKWRSVFKYDQ